MTPQFNICRGEIVDEIYIQYTLEDGSKVILTCLNGAEAAKVAQADVRGVTKKRK